MRLIHVKNLSPDMKLAKPIYDDDNNLLVNIHCKNIHKYKERLLNLGIKHIYIEDEKSENIEVENVVSSDLKRKCESAIRDTFSNIKEDKKINVKEITQNIKNLVDEILNNKNVLVNLIDIKSTDSYTFQHSVNVATLSVILANSLNYNRKQLVKIGTGAILHDVGKLAIPEEILKKPSKLNNQEYKIIKEHPSLGYKNTKNNHQISPLSRVIILYHHEQVNGEGYPDGLVKEDIHEFARLVSVADVFDALTSDRCYRDRWSARKAIDFLISKSGTKFDTEFVREFMKNIAIFPNGTAVKLNTGQKALIKEQNKEAPARPVIKIITDEQGNELDEYKTINLMNKLNIVIENELT
ncbi:HD-GYP domain-containing protein [Halanaerobacter jeridensis]|uniref:HD-GYP domain-containing protein (C-di-GMP phosphodiesterase class II) n=1 Tax=Halanaerobacter jeridensis TaxID=706427 RepID=A0A938XVV1_9FIRM|nr:HD-GYP domain-containing protein [Halanaerobacter jeridensis]MBM7556200.1 HD-GYP domain-containing protein (c-di-GMP phosphodiesterase class II) [Halanaerobacter jeridensis]